MPEPGMSASSTKNNSVGASRSNGGGGSDDSSSKAGDNKSTTADSLSRSPTTADNLASAPTTAESISGSAANEDSNPAQYAQSNLKSINSNTSLTPEQARVAAERSAMPKDNESAKNSSAHQNSKIIDESFDLLATKNPRFNVEVASVDLTVAGPNAGIDTEKRKGSISAGKVEFDVTALRTSADLNLGPLAEVDLTGNLKTVNANANLEAYGELNGLKSTVGLKGSGGAEAMAVDGKASIDISITPKSVADSIGGVYNNFIDPLVDMAAGYDVAEIPEAPASWDKGVAASGYVEGGFGVSAKAHAAAEFGKGTKNGLSAGVKLGAGPVAGFGGSVGLKWE